MEFYSWDSLLSFYLQFLMKPERQPHRVRFIMSKDNDQKVVGYIEDDDERRGYKEFIANLTFNTYPLQLVLVGGLHTYPSKMFKLRED